MDSFLAPAGEGRSEIVEKRSRFIGRITPVDSEAAAKDEIARVRSEHHDARHNCWCYIISGEIERYSDDGEPQGSAGLPMLEALRRGGIANVCCVVTRYFGGILLGTGGLSRAYTEAAKLALADAGTAEYKLCDCVLITCPYNLLSSIRSDIAVCGGVIENIEYGENVVLNAIILNGRTAALCKLLAETSAGSVSSILTGSRWARV